MRVTIQTPWGTDVDVEVDGEDKVTNVLLVLKKAAFDTNTVPMSMFVNGVADFGLIWKYVSCDGRPLPKADAEGRGQPAIQSSTFVSFAFSTEFAFNKARCNNVVVSLATNIVNIYIAYDDLLAPPHTIDAWLGTHVMKHQVGYNRDHAWETVRSLFLDDDPKVNIEERFYDDSPEFGGPMVRKRYDVRYAGALSESTEKTPQNRLIYVVTKRNGEPFESSKMIVWSDVNGTQHMAYLETEDGRPTTLPELYSLEKGFVWVGNNVVDKRKCLFGCKNSKTGGLKL